MRFPVINHGLPPMAWLIGHKNCSWGPSWSLLNIKVKLVFFETSWHFNLNITPIMQQKYSQKKRYWDPKNEPKMTPSWPSKRPQETSQHGAQIRWPLGPSSGLFGASWECLGPSLGPSWGRLGASWRCLGASWARLAGILGRLRGDLERPGRVLGASWRVLRACSLFGSIFQCFFNEFSLEIVTQKS